MSQQQDLTRQLMSQLQGAPMQQIAQQLGTNTEQANSAVSQAVPMLMNALGNQSQGGLSSILGSLGGAGGLAGMLGGLLGGGQGGQGASAGGLGDILGNVLGGNNAPQGANPQQGGLGDLGSGMPGGGTSQQQPQAPGQFGQGQQAQPGTQPANAPAQDDDGLLGNIFGQDKSTATTELGQASGLGSDGARKLLATLAPIVIAFLGARYMANRNSNDAPEAGQPAAGSNDDGGLMGSARDSGAGLRNMLDQTGDGKLDMNDIVKLGSSLFGGKR